MAVHVQRIPPSSPPPGFSVTRRDAVVTDELIEEQIEKIRDQKADWAPVDDKPAPGDMVTVLLSTADAD